MAKILFIEDDKKKIDNISKYVEQQFVDLSLDIRESYQSGLRQLLKEQYDLLLLDMSMPTFEKSLEEPGGVHQKFAGHMILKEIFRKKKPVKTIVVTMFDIFPVNEQFIPLNVLSDQLRNEFSPYFLGTVFYNGQDLQWQQEIKHLIQSNGLL